MKIFISVSLIILIPFIAYKLYQIQHVPNSIQSEGMTEQSDSDDTFLVTFNKDLSRSDLYPIDNLEAKNASSTEITLKWNYQNKKTLPKDSSLITAHPEYALLSGYRIYRDDSYYTDISKNTATFTDQYLSPNQPYSYSIAPLSFDNKIEGVRSPSFEAKTIEASSSETIAFTGKQFSKYLAEGDSITEGIHKIQIEESYVNLITEYLRTKNPDITADNKGKIAFLTSDTRAQIKKDISEAEYDLVTIGIGVNDINSGGVSMSQAKENLIDTIKTARPSANRLVILLNIPHINRIAEAEIYYKKAAAWNKMYTDIAYNFHIPLADVNKTMTENGGNDLLADYLHPNSKGHIVIADTIIEIIKTNQTPK
jgi:lysophospholipase L1-like esterase